MIHSNYARLVKQLVILGTAVIFLFGFHNWAATWGDEGLVQAAGFSSRPNTFQLNSKIQLISLQQSQALTPTAESQPASDSTSVSSTQISALTTTISSFIYLPIIMGEGQSNPSSLEAPVLLTPSDSSGTTQPVTFDWTDVNGAASYQIQLSTTSAFTSFAVKQTVVTSTFTLSSSLTGLYYWRVNASNATGNSPNSEVRSIRLVNYYGDEDGDSLPNGWELYGYDANHDDKIDIDLPALGANYLHKDVFVEMDYMQRSSAKNGLAPNRTVMDQIVKVFHEAPVSNPDGVSGIKLHLELDDRVPYDDNFPWDNGDVFEFYALKNTYFDSKRRAVYHYMIWANKYGSNSAQLPFASGYSAHVPGSDFFVTLGSFNGGKGGNNTQKTAAFIHELGHNLGLFHGGNDDRNYKPNYFSVMNYWWDLKGISHDGGINFGYQPFALPSLNEWQLNERLGLNGGSFLSGYSTTYYCPGGSKRSVAANGPMDWNCDGDKTDTAVKVDINGDGSLSTLYSQNDWASLVFHGGNVIGH